MKKLNLMISSIFLLSTTTVSAGVSADDPKFLNDKRFIEGTVRKRCLNDHLFVDEAAGRNAWARKCGYIDDEELYFVTKKRMYQSFGDIAPHDPTEPCITLDMTGYCYAEGCYPPEEVLMFGERDTPIETAYTAKLQTVTSLADLSFSLPLAKKESKIESFVTGYTEENLVRLTVKDIGDLRVTTSHPMVSSDYLVIHADEIKKGDFIWTEHGPKEVLEIRVESYKGNVWNILPESETKADNIFFANHILTGSMRYQNQWASEQSRLALRFKKK